MDYPIRRRLPCTVCGVDTFHRTGWYLVIENRWLDRLKILSWHPSLATQKDTKGVCCREHLKTIVAHWLTQASLRLSPAHTVPLPIGSDPELPDIDLGPHLAGRFLGELAVHRESFSRMWSGSPAALECILDALVPIDREVDPHPLGFQFFDPFNCSPGLSLQ